MIKHYKKKHRKYQYDLQVAQKPSNIENQINELRSKSKIVNNILYIPKGLSVTNRNFNNIETYY